MADDTSSNQSLESESKSDSLRSEISKLTKIVKSLTQQASELKAEKEAASKDLEDYLDAVQKARELHAKTEKARNALTEEERAYLEKRWKDEARANFTRHAFQIWGYVLSVLALVS